MSERKVPTKPGWWWRALQERPVQVMANPIHTLLWFDDYHLLKPKADGLWEAEIPSAAEIQSLRARVEALEGALREIHSHGCDCIQGDASGCACDSCIAGASLLNAALSAPQPNASDPDCPGAGRCHGCASWCDSCGDVDLVCDGVGRCARHSCNETGCRQQATRSEEGYGWCAEHLTPSEEEHAKKVGFDPQPNARGIE